MNEAVIRVRSCSVRLIKMASGEEDEVVLQESGRRSTRTTRAVATRRSRGRKKAATPRATRAKRNTRAAQSAESEDEEEEAQEEAEETTQESVEEQASPEAENDNEDDDEPLVVYNKSSEESIAVANGVEENNSNEQEEAEAVSSDKGAEGVSSDKGAEGVSSDKGAEGVSSDKGVDEGEEANPEKNEQAKSDEEGRSEEGVPQRDIEDADTRDAPSDSPEARNTSDDQLENKSHGDEDKDADVNGKSEPENVEDEVGEIKPEKEADNEDSHSSRNVDDREVPELEESPPPSINMTSPLRPGLKIKMETSSISSIEESQGVSQEVEVKQDDSKTEEKQEDSKTEEKQDVSKTEEKQEDSKTEEKQDVSKSDGKQEVSKTEMKQDVFEETGSNQCKIIEETKGGQESNEESESDGRKKNKTVTKKEESKNQTKEEIKKQKKESKKKAKEESKKVVVEEPMEVDQETTGKEGSETIIREDPEAMDEDAGDKPENVEEMTVLDEVKEDEEKGEEAKEAGPGDADADGTFRTEPDTEMVSEDELPTETPKEPLETEAVSDEELPDPTAAVDLPETEAVSEDELPPEKTDKKKKKSTKTTEGSGKKKTRSKEAQKRKLIDGDTYDPSSPTSENSCDESPAAKRAAVASETGGIKAKAVAKKKSLPELEKYWKAVKEDPSDFTGWTYLLQYVDQENDIEAAREAYDAFLSHYPYCYGYWRKYADYEKRKGNKEKCEEVFERGLKAIPLSVDLWIHFLNYSKATYPDDEEHLRAQFEKAINACGMEFRSDRLWESFIKWETEGKRLQNVTSLYDRLLAMPTQGYTNHFDNFQEHISGNPPQKVLSVDEFLTLRREVLQLLKQYDQPAAVADDVPPGDEVEAPPGEEPEEQPVVKSDEETTALRERIVSIRRKVHKQTVTAVADRWNYEEGIKRPYFHVKPLERCQLKNWKEYLDFEIERGDHERIIILFERCLIACALYEEFWIKFIRYLESRKEEDMTDKIRNVYERACTIHHTKKPNLHLHWAVFEESHKNYEKASEILSNLEKLVPNMLQVAYRRINLERRCNNMEKVCSLYEHYISNTKNKVISNNMAIKFARFCWKVKADVEKAISILNKAVEKDKDNPRLYLQLIDMGLQQNPLNEENIISIIDQFLSRDTDPEQKVLFAQRKVEFLEDFGSDILSVQKAHDEFQRYLKQAKDRKKKSPDLDGKSIDSKKAKSLSDSSQAHTGHSASHGSPQPAHGTASQPPQPPSNSTAAATAAAGTGQYAAASYSQTGGYSQQPPSQSGYQGGQYPPAGPQQPPTPYSQPPYNQQYGQSSDPNYANYQNWGYSQTGYGGYNQGWGNYNYY